MSVKLRSIYRWQRWPEGPLPLPGKRRTVTLQLNVEKEATFWVMEDKKQILLRTVQPWECPLTVAFAVDGDCAVVADAQASAWWSTDDGLILSYEVRTESFTQLEQRMEMTPEMEITILKANIRQEQRAREVAELLLAKKQRQEAAAANADPETGEVNDEAQEPADDNQGTANASDPATDSVAAKPKGKGADNAAG